MHASFDVLGPQPSCGELSSRVACNKSRVPGYPRTDRSFLEHKGQIAHLKAAET
jgi:hypothetical protein